VVIVDAAQGMLDRIDHFMRTVGYGQVTVAADWPMAGPKWMLEKGTALSRANGSAGSSSRFAVDGWPGHVRRPRL
jgi:hypothetical protein